MTFTTSGDSFNCRKKMSQRGEAFCVIFCIFGRKKQRILRICMFGDYLYTIKSLNHKINMCTNKNKLKHVINIQCSHKTWLDFSN